MEPFSCIYHPMPDFPMDDHPQEAQENRRGEDERVEMEKFSRRQFSVSTVTFPEHKDAADTTPLSLRLRTVVRPGDEPMADGSRKADATKTILKTHLLAAQLGSMDLRNHRNIQPFINTGSTGFVVLTRAVGG